MMKVWKILKSKISKKPTDEWYLERLKVCKGCEFNSKNKKLKGFKDYFWYVLNLFKTFCTVCGCNIKDKASIKIAECPKNKWKN